MGRKKGQEGFPWAPCKLLKHTLRQAKGAAELRFDVVRRGDPHP